MKNKILEGFTLAEVLITLGIIGIVAAITIPSLVNNISQKQITTATNTFNRKFGEALKLMNIEGVLANQNTTENFVNALGKYFKILKICDNTMLQECFEPEITWGQAGGTDLSNIKKAKDISLYNWGTNVVGVKFLNSVSALIAYNPDCKQNQFNNNLITISGNKDFIGFSTNNCMAMLYDINSEKQPNTLNKDIQRTGNVRNIKKGTIATINGVKISKIVKPGMYDPINCKDKTSIDWQYCYNSTTYKPDYWAGAAKVCEGKENMLSGQDAQKIAFYLYNNTSIPLERLPNGANYTGITRDSDKLKELADYGFPNGDFRIWLGNTSISGNVRAYYSKGTAGQSIRQDNNTDVTIVCIGD